MSDTSMMNADIFTAVARSFPRPHYVRPHCCAAVPLFSSKYTTIKSIMVYFDQLNHVPKKGSPSMVDHLQSTIETGVSGLYGFSQTRNGY